MNKTQLVYEQMKCQIQNLEEEKFYVYKMSGHYYTGNRLPVSKKVLFEGTEKECYEFVKHEMEKPYDYRSEGL